jgi:hypothetical protein
MSDDLLRLVQSLERRVSRLEAQERSLTFVPLHAALSITAWDGDARSTSGPTKIDLSVVFGLPANIKAISARLITADSAALGTTGLYFAIGPDTTNYLALTAYAIGGDVRTATNGVCPCDANGDIAFKTVASGAGTMDCWLYIWGYWI